MHTPEQLAALIAAAHACVPVDGDSFFQYDDEDSGETRRTCCHAPYRFYPYTANGNPHDPDCPAMKLAAALAPFTE